MKNCGVFSLAHNWTTPLPGAQAASGGDAAEELELVLASPLELPSSPLASALNCDLDGTPACLAAWLPGWPAALLVACGFARLLCMGRWVWVRVGGCVLCVCGGGGAGALLLWGLGVGAALCGSLLVWGAPAAAAGHHCCLDEG